MLLAHAPIRMLAIGALIFNVSAAFSQEYPNKPIRIVTGTPGGGSDFAARLVAQGISGPLGQPVIVENRSGGAAFVASTVMTKVPPDGYVITVQGGGLWLSPLLQEASYDAVRDFLPITLIEREVNILAVHPSLPVKSVKELIALARARPGELNYSQGGTGTPAHIGAELFKSMAGVNIVNVPYKGAVPAVTAAISGEVHLTIADVGLVTPHMKSGRLRALAVTSVNPSALAPGLPAIAEAGLPGYETIGMTGLLAPAKTPAAIITKLNQETVRVLNQPDVKKKFLDTGVEPVGNSPDEFSAAIKADIARTSKVIKDAGIRENK